MVLQRLLRRLISQTGDLNGIWKFEGRQLRFKAGGGTFRE